VWKPHAKGTSPPISPDGAAPRHPAQRDHYIRPPVEIVLRSTPLPGVQRKPSSRSAAQPRPRGRRASPTARAAAGDESDGAESDGSYDPNRVLRVRLLVVRSERPLVLRIRVDSLHCFIARPWTPRAQITVPASNI
jgi:hypothetical protein